jgi:hypothetical protein
MDNLVFAPLTKLPLKDIWPGEATNFTPWLSKNLDVLSNELGMDLELESIESAVGDFSADIVVRNIATNQLIIIENQYGVTDHRHLGQILTYAANRGAAIVIWIAEKIRSEHKSAIDFLNLNLKETLGFYLIEASIVKIENSKPAFILNVISEPPDFNVSGSGGQQVISESREKYRQFFQGLIDELREKHGFTNARLGQPQSWYAFSSNNSKIFKYGASFAQGQKFRTEVYIDSNNKELNESLFDKLLEKKAEIEAQFGSELNWERLDSKRACRIALYRDGDIEADSENLAVIKNWAIEKLLKFKAVFPQRIDSCLGNIRQTSDDSLSLP